MLICGDPLDESNLCTNLSWFKLQTWINWRIMLASVQRPEMPFSLVFAVCGTMLTFLEKFMPSIKYLATFAASFKKKAIACNCNQKGCLLDFMKRHETTVVSYPPGTPLLKVGQLEASSTFRLLAELHGCYLSSWSLAPKVKVFSKSQCTLSGGSLMLSPSG